MDGSRARRRPCEPSWPPRGGRVSAVGREERVLRIIETARSKRPRFRDEQVTLAHGAGGKATRTLIEGLLVPAFANESLAALADAGSVDAEGVGLRVTTDSF